jgi:hypothetical protein
MLFEIGLRQVGPGLQVRSWEVCSSVRLSPTAGGVVLLQERYYIQYAELALCFYNDTLLCIVVPSLSVVTQVLRSRTMPNEDTSSPQTVQ